MFQYTFGCMLQEKYNQHEILADFSGYSLPDSDGIRIPRILELNTGIQLADQRVLNQIFMLNHKTKSKNWQRIVLGTEALFNQKYCLEWNRAWINPERLLSYEYYDGYWQCWKYLNDIEHILRVKFQLQKPLGDKSKKAIEYITSVNSIMVGIRRGDYLEEQKHYGTFGIEYYYRCMDYICERVTNPVFIIFSNDIEWVKKNMPLGKYSVVYRTKEEQDSDTEELMVMAACKHYIIVNSTYQWWGAWLSRNPEKIVIAPEQWFSDNKPIDIVPPDWIKMQR